jgi:hypothetical protein
MKAFNLSKCILHCQFWSKSSQGITMTQTMETPQFVNYVTTNYPNSLAAQFFKGAPSGAAPTSGFQTVSQIEQSLVSPYLPPGIPGDLVALGNVSISQSPINNGFQGHMRINALSEFADCLIRKEQLSQSIQILDRGSQLHPNSVQLKYNLAIAQLRSHHPVEAIRSCRL